MAKYGIATVFEDIGVGYEFSQDHIPIHLTHVDSFQSKLNVNELADLLSKTLIDQKPFEVQATKDTFYGPGKDIPVTEIELSPQLLHLHSVIMQILSGSNAILKNPNFHNDGYRPHVSIYDTRRIQPGDILSIDNLVIASKTFDTDDSATRILAKINL